MTAHGAMAPNARPGRARRYSAFISYSHADRAAVFKLHARLEGYRLPRRLAEQIGISRIRPVFIDRAEMAASPDLAEVTRKALAEADFLIVACTPHTPRSDWVAREIAAFRELRGRDAILVALLGGNERTSFPRALLDDGHGHVREPLAADFRHEGDGRHRALLKLLATLLGVDLDELIHRDARRQRNRKVAWTSTSAALALVIAALGRSAWNARAETERGRIAASQTMERQLDDLRAQIRAGGTLDMAAAVTRNIAMFYDQQPASGNSPEVELGRAKLLQAEAEDELTGGNLKSGEAKAREALRATSGVIAREPNDTKAVFLHAQSAYWVGYAAWLQGDTALAANAFARYADLADRLVRADPSNTDWLMERAYANSNLGTLALREARDPKLAGRYFGASQQAFHEIERRRPNDPDILVELADGEAWLGDTMAMQEDLASARRHRDEQRRLLTNAIERDPANRFYRSLMIGARLGQATLEGDFHHYAAAIGILRSTLRDADAMVAADPKNETLSSRRRAVELLLARAELDAAGQEPAGVARARKLIGDCAADWSNGSDELRVFCSLLAARLAMLNGDRAAARRIVADPRVAAALKRRSLTQRFHLDVQATCRQIGDPALCD